MYLDKSIPSSLRGKVFILLQLLLSMTCLSAMTPGGDLETVIVQFEMSEQIIASEQAYTEALEMAMREAMKEGEADLVIFPEYIGVFPSLIPWYSYLEEERPFEELWFAIQQSRPEIRDIKDLFMRESARTEDFLDSLWGNLARKYDVFILSGSRLSARGSRLMNQAVVYSPEGDVAYRQNKYFLTDFETDILGLSPGNLKETGGFRIKEQNIKLTICRDTFLRDWEELHREGELWIDIKANGVAFTEDQLALFARALPARIINTSVPYGITACLTGNFLNLFWEGESSIIYNSRGKVEYLQTSRGYEGFEVMRETFPEQRSGG